ncbi:hypothetical protein mRhiFer1_008829 [Rhinolophus ferrumequinum]|uniref:Uncharacterized protein n=1 Tax=Rhinolophus ferrumequinum TaxID=59479 RepID=A0A7J8AF19_RHIFE|nr:hypothetical protein mRhiFer1_008829 [Rhinolophus ferrumequinum]
MDSLNGGIPYVMLPMSSSITKSVGKGLSKTLSQWAAFLRFVCSDNQEREAMFKQELFHSFSSANWQPESGIQASRLDTKQNLKRDFWKMIHKAKACQPELQTIIEKECFPYTAVKKLRKDHNAAENG